MFDLSEIGESCGIYNGEDFVWPPVIRLAYQSVESCQLCLLEDGFNFFLYIIELHNKY